MAMLAIGEADGDPWPTYSLRIPGLNGANRDARLLEDREQGSRAVHAVTSR